MQFYFVMDPAHSTYSIPWNSFYTHIKWYKKEIESNKLSIKREKKYENQENFISKS